MPFARTDARCTPADNALLQRLSSAQLRSLMGILELRPLQVDQVLGYPEQALQEIVFPLSGLVVESTGLGPLGQTQLNVVGAEGMLGRIQMQSPPTPELRTSVAGNGFALVIDRRRVGEALLAAPALAGLIARYQSLKIGQLARTALCLGFHQAQSRLARWLLEAADRSGRLPIEITHERLALLLGLRRTGVTVCAGRLSARGLIDYQRGVICILDRAGLEHAACSCFSESRDAYVQAFPSRSR